MGKPKTPPRLRGTYNAKGERLKALAQSFDARRSAATALDLPLMAWHFQQFLKEEHPDMLPNPRSGGILGKIDQCNRVYLGSGYQKFRLRHWSRRQLYNRHKWLKGELSRLILKQKVCKSPEERLALILKRREQIAMYSAALDYYKPLHNAVRQARKVKARTKNRQRVKTDKRKREIAEALNKSKTLLPL